MLTNRQILSDFRELVVDKQHIPDHNAWSGRLVYHHLRNARAKLMYEKLHDKKKKLSTHIYQTIPCIPLKKIDTTECPCAPQLGCMFLRTVYPIPKMIGMPSSVTSSDGQGLIDYDYVDWDKFKWKMNTRYKFNRTKGYFTFKQFENGTHIYVYNDNLRKLLTVTGVFEDPLDVYFFPDCSGKIPDCLDPLERPFLIDADLVPTMYDLTLNTLMQTKGRLQVDKRQDAVDEDITQIQK